MGGFRGNLRGFSQLWEGTVTSVTMALACLVDRRRAGVKVAPAQCARIVQSCKNGEGLPIQVYGGRDLITQKLSPIQPVYIDVAQERSQVFWTWTARFFFNSFARTGWTEQTYGEKSGGHRPFWEFPTAIHTKTRMLFGQHFDGEVPRNLNHVFLRPFEHGFNKKKLGRLCSKIKMTEPP